MRLALGLLVVSGLLLAYAPYPYALAGLIGTIFVGIPLVGAVMVRVGLSDLIDGVDTEKGGAYDRY